MLMPDSIPTESELLGEGLGHWDPLKAPQGDSNVQL